jgi:uncharacterized protein
LKAHLEKLKKIVEEYTKPFGAHDFEHTLRVYENCLYIGPKKGADMSILLPAALLHDIGRAYPRHAYYGSKLAEAILLENGYSIKKIKKICNAIATHSFSEKKIPNSLEAKILSDADKLDAMGAVGIYRTAIFNAMSHGNLKTTIEHFYNKLLKLKNLLYTDIAIQLALSRHEFMKEFLNQLEIELNLTD